METEGYVADNAFMREDKHEVVPDFKSQTCAKDVNLLATKKNNGDIDNIPQLRDLMRMEDSRNVQEHQSGDSITQHTVPVGDVKKLEKETKSYAKKSVTERELPELIVCLKEASYNVVKDICIDEEVPSIDKTSIENDELNHNEPFSRSDLNVQSELIKGRAASISDEVKPSVEYDAKMDVSSESPSANMIENGGGDFSSRHENVNVSSSEKVVPEETLPVRVVQTGNTEHRACNSDGDNGPQQTDQETSKDAESSNFEMPCTAEESNCINANKVPLNDKMESGSAAVNPGFSPPAESVIGEDPQNSDSQQVVQTIKPSSLEDGSPESRSASSSSLFPRHGHGEKSFSAVDSTPSALATYSGPIPYSGSVSLRSDSSTTSTRSFAFPVLHSEWNSSPVRMAKADRRHYRKHQRWKLSLLCCKF